MAARPVVDGIESQHAGQLTVIHLNVQDPTAPALMSRFAVEYTPTFLFFDAQGHEVWRTVGAIDPAAVQRSLSAP